MTGYNISKGQFPSENIQRRSNRIMDPTLAVLFDFVNIFQGGNAACINTVDRRILRKDIKKFQVNALLFAMEDLSGIGGVKRPGIVHRLDKDTSGLLMVAKNDMAHQSLSDQLRERSMEKHYLAVVDGCMKEESGLVDKPIARSKKDRKKMAIDPEGRDALTEWTLVKNLKNAALLDVHILTGRTHQIRVHMQSLHHPVAGDPIYGAKNGVKVPRLMLHAHTLAFDHPRTGERLFFRADPPEAFERALKKLR